MKYNLLNSLHIVVFLSFSCSSDRNSVQTTSKQKNEKDISKIEDKKIPEKKYLSFSELYDYVIKTPVLKLDRSLPYPFNEFEFDKVIGYDCDGNVRSYKSVTEDGFYSRAILKQQALTNKQVYFLVDLLTSNSTYGGTVNGCWEPRLGFIFYKDNIEVFKTDICLGCNYLKSTIEFPATSHKKIEVEGTSYVLDGFSDVGKLKIRKLSAQFDFQYGQEL